jgi:hypothetical protein
MFEEKFHKFTKILNRYDLHEYEFRLTHLYLKIKIPLQMANDA